MGKRDEVAGLIKAWTDEVTTLVDKCEAKKHFMEGGKGVSCFIWVSIKITDLDTGTTKHKRELACSSNCLDEGKFKKEVAKIDGFHTAHYEASGFCFINLD